jgi:protein-L-isoaspartate(D-aspartate) O-methyltransferase
MTLEEMIEYDLKDRGIRDKRLLEAFRRIDRKLFVPQMSQDLAYEDRALILTHGQTISQPYMVGVMTQALNLRGGERVLEIGTGSGFQTGILACLAKEVFTVERVEYLSTTAEDRLEPLGLTNIHYLLGDGSLGWPEHAPFDRILVTAACPQMPPRLVEQLAEDGIIAAPIGPPDSQTLTIGTKKRGLLALREDTPCIFVKLIGADGYAEGG